MVKHKPILWEAHKARTLAQKKVERKKRNKIRVAKLVNFFLDTIAPPIKYIFFTILATEGLYRITGNGSLILLILDYLRKFTGGV